MSGARYEIVVRGRLGRPLTRWFEDLDVRACGPDTTSFTGWFPDQAALQGMLAQLGDLYLELVSLRQLADDD